MKHQCRSFPWSEIGSGDCQEFMLIDDEGYCWGAKPIMPVIDLYWASVN